MTSDKEVPCCCSQRWILAYVACFGFTFVYAVCVNLSVAIVCMVKTVNTSLFDSPHNVTHDGHCSEVLAARQIYNQYAEFEWDKGIQATLMASFFYGHIATQVPGGWLADRFGGRRVFAVAMLIASAATLLTPLCARLNYQLLYVLRVIIGLSTGLTIPAMQSMWGRWAPTLERSRLVTLTFLGTLIGNIITFASSGYLCEHGFDNGWGSIFYITGGLSGLWVVIWFILVRDTPCDHPWITEVEKNFIRNGIEYDTSKRISSVPWRKLAKSPALFACSTAHFCNQWTGYTLLTKLPTFMRSVLKFDIKSNGLYSAVPYICEAVVALLAGQAADFVRYKGLLATTATRRLFSVISFSGGAVCLVIIGFLSCDQRQIAVVLLALCVTFRGFNRAGYAVNHVDFGPKYAGVLYGIINTFGTIPGMVAPIVAATLTPNDSPEEWLNVFYVCAGFSAIGMIVFSCLSQGEIQEWAKDVKEVAT